MILRILALFLALTSAVAAQTAPESFPQPLSDTVSDFSAVLDATEEGRIQRALQQVRDETGVQMVVVTVPSLAVYGGAYMRLDSFAKALFNAWGVGAADRNDGILMLVVTGEREVRIALGAGYDAVYDGRAARVLSTAVLPEFREGRLAGGIEAGIISARDRLITPFLAGQPVSLTDGFAPETGGDSGSALPVVGAVGGIVSLLAFAIWRGARSRRTCPKCGKQTLTRTNEVITPAGMLTSGTGLEHLLCTSCGHTDRRTYTIRTSSSRDRGSRFGSSSGGGRSSGGFGGGRSSGGGASGKW